MTPGGAENGGFPRVRGPWPGFEHFRDEEVGDFYLNALGARYDENRNLQASFGFGSIGQKNLTVEDAEYLAHFGKAAAA